MESGFRCSAGHQTHWQGASKGGVQKRAWVDLRGRLGAPVALAEIYQEYKSPQTKIRRLHLMVVDLSRSRSVSTHVYQDFMNCHIPPDLAGCLNTLTVPISRKDCPFKARFVFAYGVDNSDKPSYLMWPIRGVNGQFLLVYPWSGNYFNLEAARFMEPIGLEHFFDAFSLDRKRTSRSRVRGSTPSVRALKSVYASSDFSKSETSEESSWLLTSEFDPELSLASSSELPFALSSLLGGIGTSLAEDSLTSAVFALISSRSVLERCLSSWWHLSSKMWICKKSETWGVFTLGDTRK